MNGNLNLGKFVPTYSSVQSVKVVKPVERKQRVMFRTTDPENVSAYCLTLGIYSVHWYLEYLSLYCYMYYYAPTQKSRHKDHQGKKITKIQEDPLFCCILILTWTKTNKQTSVFSHLAQSVVHTDEICMKSFMLISIFALVSLLLLCHLC